MNTIYKTLPPPNIKIMSCIFERIFSAFRYFARNTQNQFDLFLYLFEMDLTYQTEIRQQPIPDDPWFYQSICFQDNTPINTQMENDVYGSLNHFLKMYNLRITYMQNLDFPGFLDELIRSFQKNKVTILIIDQYFNRHSHYYHKMLNANHALLIKGIDTEKEEIIICDKKDIPYSFDEIKDMMTGTIIQLGYNEDKGFNRIIPNYNFIYQKHKQKLNILQTVSPFLQEILENMNQESRISFFAKAYHTTILYQLIPFLTARNILFDNLDIPTDFKDTTITSKAKWEEFSYWLMKISILNRFSNEHLIRSALELLEIEKQFRL